MEEPELRRAHPVPRRLFAREQEETASKEARWACAPKVLTMVASDSRSRRWAPSGSGMPGARCPSTLTVSMTRKVPSTPPPGMGSVEVEVLAVDRVAVIRDGRGLPDPTALLAGTPEDDDLAQPSRHGPGERHRQRAGDVRATGDDQRLP